MFKYPGGEKRRALYNDHPNLHHPDLTAANILPFLFYLHVGVFVCVCIKNPIYSIYFI